MNVPIYPGDLVVVTDACCDEMRREFLGCIFTVSRVTPPLLVGCQKCGTRHTVSLAVATEAFFTANDWGEEAPLPYIKRIPPLSELESEQVLQGISQAS